MTYFFLLNPVKNTTEGVDVDDPTQIKGGWYPRDKHIVRKKSTKAVLKLKRLEELKEGAHQNKRLKLENIPRKITKDLSRVKVGAEKLQLIEDFRNRLIKHHEQELERERMAVIEHARILQIWNQVQEETLILFMFTEGEA